MSSKRCAPAVASSIDGPSLTGPAPTAKPNASFRHCFENGPTSAPTHRQLVGPPHSHDGCTATTITGLTVVLVDDHQSPGWLPSDEQRAWKAQLAQDPAPSRRSR